MNKIIVIISLLLLFSFHQVAEKPDGSIKSAISSNINIKKAFISFRVGIGQSLDAKRFDKLLDLFDKYKGVTDEITFFTSETHPPIPLDVLKKRLAIFKDRMEQARKRGYRTGIDVLSTVGHLNENLENSLHGDYTRMTDINGNVCMGAFCPNDEKYREQYIKEVYKATALANPDYIWIDDDIRLQGYGPVNYACFCDKCLDIFAKEYGTKYTRESLKKAFNEGTIEQKLKIREEWLQHNRNTIARLFTLIEKTVHNVGPKIQIGFMTGDRFYAGYDFANWAKILAGPHNIPVMWRPGGGYYNDNNTDELVGKSNAIGRQVSALPKKIFSIQAEIENFPYQRLKKAANMVVLEACSDIAAGCTGAAFNVLSFYDEPLDEYEPLLARIQKARPFFDLMAKSLGRSALSGIQTFWNKNSFVTENLVNGSWFKAGSPVVDHEIYDIGLPACYSNKNAKVTILGKDNIYDLSHQQITTLLSGGVYMDAETLQQLNDMGFSDLTGFKVVGSENKDRIEEFSDDLLNGDFSGRERDGRQSFWPSLAYQLQKTCKSARVLSRLIDYTGKTVSNCTMGIYENKLGGRICVAGYCPWTFMEDLSKSSQMKSVFRWLSKDSLPGYIASFQKINLWIREPQNGKIALAFTNSSFDPAKNVILMLRTENRAIKLYDMDCRGTVIRSSGADGPYQKFIIPYVDPWQIRLVVTE